MAQAKNPPLESLLVDAALAAGRGIGTMKVSQGAIDVWAKGYKASFSTVLGTNPNWKKDRPKVLAQAVRLGRLARKLAQDEKRVEITRQIAKRASKIIAQDKRCHSILPPGSGKYCPPSGV